MSEIFKRSFWVNNDINEKITGDIRLPAGRENLPAVFIIHGFKGFKDWGFFPYTGEKIASHGAIAINFNFSMNGKDGSDSDILEHVEKFAENNLSRQLKDIDILINSFMNGNIIPNEELKNLWNGQIYLLGHSLGGAVSIITAKENSYINKISLWASISTLERYTKRQKDLWRKNGFLDFVNMRTNQTLRLNLSYLEDIENNPGRFDLPNAISQLNIPVQIIHGTQDLTVPVKEAEALVKAAKEENLFLTYIPHTGHTFGIEHPLEKPTPALDTAIVSTINFFGLTD